MIIALAISKLCPAPQFFGSVTANTPEAWEKVRWLDSRPKPAWEELEAAWEGLSIELAVSGFEAGIRDRLDAFARTIGYDSMMSACTYAASSVEMYRIEGQYCVDARDASWAKAYALLREIRPQVETGGEIPSWETIEAQLPVLTWPEGSRGYVGITEE